MPRALFEKKGSAVYISHLDLMRAFQRAFKRAGLPLTHTKGFNPRPSVSIALPLSLGVESNCELLDFELEGTPVSHEELRERLNTYLIDGVQVTEIYEEAQKLKNLSFLDCRLVLEYDNGVPENAIDLIRQLFVRDGVIVEKKGKNGIVEQDIIPMIRSFDISQSNAQEIVIDARVCCQNPSLNPMQISTAIEKYLPDLMPDFVRYTRKEMLDANEKVFR